MTRALERFFDWLMPKFLPWFMLAWLISLIALPAYVVYVIVYAP